MLIRIHTQPPWPSEFTSPPSYRLPERTSPIVSHIAETLPDRVLYLHFWTSNSLSSSVRRYLWNTGHGGSLSVVRTGGRRMAPNQCCIWRVRNHRPYQFRKFLTRGLRMYEYASCDEWWYPWCQCPVACPGCHSSVSAGVGCTGHSRPADRAQKVHKQDAILIPKDSGHNFLRRRSCPELPSSKRLRMFHFNGYLFVSGPQLRTHDSSLVTTPRKNFAWSFAGQNVKFSNGTLLHHCLHTDVVQTLSWAPKSA